MIVDYYIGTIVITVVTVNTVISLCKIVKYTLNNNYSRVTQAQSRSLKG